MHTEGEKNRGAKKEKQCSGQSPGPWRMRAHEAGWGTGGKEEILDVNVVDV